MKKDTLKAYEILQEKYIESIHAMGYLLKHKKTDAEIVVFSNSDENKVFSIGFRTPPTNDTGVAHIIEHSVLCGSKNFPVKDPFIELVKGSLNTFLNAMTFPDKTIYPVASCNAVDFQNLMHVYLDAVFYPKIYEKENIFLQEGWHYDCTSIKSPLSINGVVYSEMKGVFSSPDDVMEREVLNSLFPETSYACESGGDPIAIPSLSYAEFLDFHKKYYHPSNSYIYLYGDMDIDEKLMWIDNEYLSQFEKISIDSAIKLQTPFKEPVFKTIPYAITEEESNLDATYLTYNVAVCKDNLDPLQYIAYQILDYALCSAPGAPIKQALMDGQIGKEIYSTYENGIAQPYFSFVVKGTNENERDNFISIIKSTLQKIVNEGIDQNALEGALNYYEFKCREADFGSYPKGLMYGLKLLDGWLYTSENPFIHMEELEVYKELRLLAKEGYFERLIQEGILNNTHISIITVIPDKLLLNEKQEAIKSQLDKYRASLSRENLQAIIDKTKELARYQEEEDKKEDIEKIPILKRTDIKREIEPILNEVKSINSCTSLYHNVDTNGILYASFFFKANEIDANELPYLALLKSILSFVNTKNFSYEALSHEINKQTGGISFGVTTYKNAKDFSQYDLYFTTSIRVLEENAQKGFELIEEILLTSVIEDTKRLKEIIVELKSKMQAQMTARGDQLAATCATSYFSETAAIAERMQGISFYRLLESFENNFDSQKEILVKTLQSLMHRVFRKENLLIDCTGSEMGYNKVVSYTENLIPKLYNMDMEKHKLTIIPKKENVGYQSSSQVQYVCIAGDYTKYNLKFTGALDVLKVIMGYDYLWNRVRVKGGAYGCGIVFTKSGEGYMSSYRDPNLEKTISTFTKAADFIAHFSVEERELTKYVIGTISNLDAPLTPKAKGARSLSIFLSKIEETDLQMYRNQVLDVTMQDIRALKPYLLAINKEDAICVVGNNDIIKASKDKFMRIEPLFH